MRSIYSLGLLILSLALAAGTASAAPGDLDSGFGVGGVVTIGSGDDWDDAEPIDIDVAPDGKIVAAGRLAGPTNAYGFVTRLTPGGVPDPTFDGDGTLFTLLNNAFASIHAVKVQPDGKIVVGGFVRAGAGQDVAVVARLNFDGSLDASFNAGGTPGTLAVASVATDAAVEDLALQPDGKIVAVVGVDGPVDSARTVRVTAAGALDTTFNTPTGWRTTVFNLSFDSYLNSIAVRPDGRGVACGSGGDAIDDVSFGFTSHTTAGTADAGFGGGTFLLPNGDSGMNDVCYGLALQSDGKAIAAGFTTNGSSSRQALITRVTTTGTKDSSFGAAGEILEPQGDQVSFANDVVVDTDDKFYAVGRARFNTINGWAVWGHLPDGTPDPLFGDKGLSFNSFGTGWPNAAAIGGSRLYLLGSTDGVKVASVKLKNDPVMLPPAPPAARARITSPSKSRLVRTKLKRIAGTATATGAAIAKVEVAVQRVGSKKSKRCAWLKSTRAKFRTFRKTRAGCKKMVWLKASGTASWSLKLKKSLPTGTYRIHARATPVGGSAEATFKKSLKNLRTVKLRAAR